jgi:heme exporter protein CcmD
MSEFFAMGGNGAYVWTAYGITLALLIWNVWSAQALLRRNLRSAGRDAVAEEPARRPKVSQLEEE